MTDIKPIQFSRSRFFRPRLALTHLLISATIVGSLSALLWWRWYAWPVWYLVDAEHVFLILVAIDLVLGPCMTLIIANPKKTWRVLSRDLTVIAAIQIAALSWGMHTLWEARPVFIVYAVDRFELVQATQFPDEKSLKELKLPEKVLQVDPAYRSDPWRSLLWVYARQPTDTKEKSDLTFSAIAGVDIQTLPYYYHPLAEGKDQMLARAADYDRLKTALAGHSPPIVLPQVADPGQTVAWPINSQKRAGIVLLDRSTLKLQGFVGVDDPFSLPVWPK